MQGVVTPNWLAAISGRSSPSSTSGASTMPAIAAAALAMMRALRRVDAGDVDDGGGEHHVALADDRPRVGGGDRRDDELRHADRQAAHGLRGDRGAAGAAERQHAVAAPLVEEPADDHRRRPRPSRSRPARDRPRRAARRRRAPAAAATSSRVTSGSVCGGPRMPASTSTVSTPAARRRSRRNPNSTPFVSSVPTSTTVFATRPPSAARGAASGARRVYRRGRRRPEGAQGGVAHGHQLAAVGLWQHDAQAHAGQPVAAQPRASAGRAARPSLMSRRRSFGPRRSRHGAREDHRAVAGQERVEALLAAPRPQLDGGAAGRRARVRQPVGEAHAQGAGAQHGGGERARPAARTGARVWGSAGRTARRRRRT